MGGLPDDDRSRIAACCLPRLARTQLRGGQRAPVAQTIQSRCETAADDEANAQVLRALLARVAFYKATLPFLTGCNKVRGRMRVGGITREELGSKDECIRITGTTRAIPAGWTD
ncbi:MAG: hypothetical protein CMJ64_02215 [Planctomycetaceae bacterium]|nr:hypothetical protein [Planctomycetaceae bacterium]